MVQTRMGVPLLDVSADPSKRWESALRSDLPKSDLPDLIWIMDLVEIKDLF